MEQNNESLSKIFDKQFNQSINNREINILMDKLANEWIEIAKRLPNPKPLFGNIFHLLEIMLQFHFY